MKKLDRFRFIEQKFGRRYVQEYHPCSDFGQICVEADKFLARGLEWNLRTDTHPDARDMDQAMLSPFIFQCTKEKAAEIWGKFGASLIYIVMRCMPLCYLNGVAKRVNEETVFVEFNEIDGHVPQRFMYEVPAHLSHLNIGQFRRSVLIPELWPGPVFMPYDEAVTSRKLDEVYELLLSSDENEITFAVRHPDKQLIIW